MSYESQRPYEYQQHDSGSTYLDYSHDLFPAASHPYLVASPAISRPLGVAPTYLLMPSYECMPSPESSTPGLTPSIGTSSEDDNSGAADSPPDVNPSTISSSTFSPPKNSSFIPYATIGRSRAAPKKASHARKTSPDHIRRPPNAFILFRSNCCNLDTPGVPSAVQLASLGITDHRHISRIASVLWKALSLPDRQYWDERAREAKAEHVHKYPDYKYKLNMRSKDGARSCKKVDPDELATEKQGCEDVARALLLVPDRLVSEQLRNLRKKAADEAEPVGTDQHSYVGASHAVKSPSSVRTMDHVAPPAADTSRPLDRLDSPRRKRVRSTSPATAWRCDASAVTLQAPYADDFLDVDPRDARCDSHMQEYWRRDWDTRGFHDGHRDLFLPPEPALAETHNRTFEFYHAAEDPRLTSRFDYSTPIAPFDQGSYTRTSHVKDLEAGFAATASKPQFYSCHLDQNVAESIYYQGDNVETFTIPPVHTLDPREYSELDSKLYQFDVPACLGAPFVAQPWTFPSPANPATYVSCL